MLVKNWMLAQQHSVTSDASATEALLIIEEHNLKMLPVVDNSHLRGIVHRKDLSEAALCVSGSNDVCEMNYFCNKLKVKDIMVRMPITVSMNDTVEDTLIKGRETLMSTFPVMDGEKVVGVVSDREIYITLFKLLEAGTKRTRVTLKNVSLEPGTLSDILSIVEHTNSTARAIFTVPEGDSGRCRVVLRLDSREPQLVKQRLEAGGYGVLEFTE